jgi:RNA polymerase-binding transcription factor DksA
MFTGKDGTTVDTIKLGIYQDRLVRRRRETLSSLKRLAEENAGIPKERQLDWIDQAVLETETRLVDRLNQSYSRELDRIQAALGRIQTGTYGACIACHRPIEKKRLDFFPEADFCSRCQDTREAFEKAH